MSRAVGKRTSRDQAHRLRIIGGQWRGRPIEFPADTAIRPSPDRVRETLFNWLQSEVRGARCLDLFAGSGALGIEALSRGAAHVTFVERDPRVAAHLQRVLERLGATDAVVRTGDAAGFLRGPPTQFDLVFLDPPFASDLLERACAELSRGWLSENAWIYIEQPAGEPPPRAAGAWRVHRSKRAGQVGYHLLRVA